MIYGKGLYRDMSAEVAPQGIAQDYITLFVAIPLLILSFLKARKGCLKGKYLFAGILGYFFSNLFVLYGNGYVQCHVFTLCDLTGASFYSFILGILSFDTNTLQNSFKLSTPVKMIGGFLILNSIVIGLLWLSIVVPPLLNGTIVPLQVEHYTTLIVQGLDLGILLPASFISGVLLIRKRTLGYLSAPLYFVFLSLLMTSLSAKIIEMKMLSYNVIPAIFIIPTFNIITVVCTVILLKSIKKIS